MSATIDAYEKAMKEVWTQDRLEKQMYSGTLILDELEKTSRYHTGEAAYVPLHSNRGGGYSSMPASGGQLNTAGEQGINRVPFNYTHHNYQIEIESAAIDQTDGKPNAVASVVETEVSGALDDTRKQLQRQIVSDGTALIARCDTTSSSTEVELLNPAEGGDGFDAIERGWLHEGSQVVIGTTGNETSIATVREVTAVEESVTTPSITISGAAVDTTNAAYVSLSKGRSGTVSREMFGLEKLCSNTATFGLDPATYGFWKPAGVDSTTTDISVEAMLWGGRKVHQKTGMSPDLTVMGLDQMDEFYSQLQLQVNFAGDKAIGAGDREGIKWAGQRIFADPDVKARTVFFLSKKHLFIVGIGKPYWQNKISGGKILEYKQGYTSFVATLFHRCNLGTNRRNAHAALTQLDRPTSV